MEQYVTSHTTPKHMFIVLGDFNAQLIRCHGPDQRVAKNGAKYTLLVEWKTNKVAKVNSYGSLGLGVEFGTWR